VRTYELNSYCDWEYGEANNNYPGWYNFHKTSEFAPLSPSDLFTFIDTSPVSVCYPAFVLSAATTVLWHRPSVEHNSRGNVTFADSHAETHHWVDPVTIDLAHTTTRVGPSPDPSWMTTIGMPDGDHLRFIPAGNQDLIWLHNHCSASK
jgi:prepilin-type processing-associated H-X9-DG protein